MRIQALTDKLREERTLSDAEFEELFAILSQGASGPCADQVRICEDIPQAVCSPEEAVLYGAARQVREEYYGKDVYLRGLIEFTNYCRNDCRYCGIRRSNRNAERYRLSKERDIVSSIRGLYPDCAITLSIGEKTRESYKAYKDAGADRYLLRQETSSPAHYRYLHPEELTIENRKRCLADLKDLGYQVGCGIMVGSPGQTLSNVIEDLRYMRDFGPHMVGVGPFIPHRDTPFRDEKPGTLKDTLHLLAVIRLMLPGVLLPATTALGTIHPVGRELGLLAGANVIMPNLSPVNVRGKYLLYDGKICTGDEAASCRSCMDRRIERAGYRTALVRGDCAGFAAE